MSHKPRVKVTLSPETFATIEALADLGGTSMSKVIGELVESVAPMLTRQAAFMQAASEADQATKEKLLAAFDAIEAELVGAVGSAQARTYLAVQRATGGATPSSGSKRAQKGSQGRQSRRKRAKKGGGR